MTIVPRPLREMTNIAATDIGTGPTEVTTTHQVRDRQLRPDAQDGRGESPSSGKSDAFCAGGWWGVSRESSLCVQLTKRVYFLRGSAACSWGVAQLAHSRSRRLLR